MRDAMRNNAVAICFAGSFNTIQCFGNSEVANGMSMHQQFCLISGDNKLRKFFGSNINTPEDGLLV